MKYYYLLMSQQDMIENQVLEELLRERTNYYLSKEKNLDFWINISPKFIYELNLENEIKRTNFYKQKESNIKYKNGNEKEFYSALISLDKNFINWIQLRLGYFENIKSKKNLDLSLSYVSDGIFGYFDNTDLHSNSALSNCEDTLHPSILSKRHQILASH